MLSSAEKKFIEDGVRQDFRSDGRSCIDIRDFIIEEDVIPSCFGSCRVVNDDTDLICSVKCEIKVPKGVECDEGDFTIDIELSPSITSDMENQEIERVSNELSERVNSLLTNPNIINTKKLCIFKHHFAWHIKADIHIFNAGGNLIDAISIALRKACAQAMLPRLNVVQEVNVGEGKDTDDVDDVPPKIKAAGNHNDVIPIPDVDRIPIIISSAYIAGKLVLDPNQNEEKCSVSLFSVAVNSSGRCVGIAKRGNSCVEISLLPKLMQQSVATHKKIWKKLFC